MRNRRLIAAGLAVLLAFPIGLSNISAEAAEVMSQSGNNSDSYKKVTVDPGSGYSIVETEDYTAVLPKGGRVVSYGSNECSSEMLEETTYSRDEYIVEFDRAGTEQEMYEHLVSVHPELSSDAARSIAIQPTDNIEKAQEAMLLGNEKSGVPTIINLGKIVDGKLVMDEPKTPVLDQYTSIISEGWYVTPHLEKHQLWCDYIQRWEGLDLYQSSDSGTYSFTEEVSVSVNVGFNASGGLKASEALSFGLAVSAAQTVTSKITRGYTLNVGAWKKHVVRPYIYSYDDLYSGVYRYYCYNVYDNSYFYIPEQREAVNKYEVEHSIRSWVRENTAHNPNASSPIPPLKWEW